MPDYFLNYPDCPKVNVTWRDAKAYRDWVGRDLPTEARWEKAARGYDGRACPWGDGPPDGTRGNFADRSAANQVSDTSRDDGYAFTAPVGSYPAGASPYGCLDMAGNVWEWCRDWGGWYHAGPDPGRAVRDQQGSPLPSIASPAAVAGGARRACCAALVALPASSTPGTSRRTVGSRGLTRVQTILVAAKRSRTTRSRLSREPESERRESE
jgi:formylglycine-generating enzyme required for sulfatase activity